MNPIINNPSSRNKVIILIEKVIMIICTILLWYFLLRHIFDQLTTVNYYKTIAIFKFLLIVSIVIFIVMFVWQYYNLRMFGSLDRRKSRGTATDDVVSKMLHIDADALPQLRAVKYVQLKRVDKISYYFAENIPHGIAMQLIPNSEVDFFSNKANTGDEDYKIKIK